MRFWGGKRTIECPLQNHFWRPQKVGFVWSVPVSSKGVTWREQIGGGGERIISGGVQNCFRGGVLWYVFPSPEFSTPPLFLSEELGVPKPGCFKPGRLQSLRRSALLHSFAPFCALCALFCALLRSFAPLRLRSFAHICVDRSGSAKPENWPICKPARESANFGFSLQERLLTGIQEL